MAQQKTKPPTQCAGARSFPGAYNKSLFQVATFKGQDNHWPLRQPEGPTECPTTSHLPCPSCCSLFQSLLPSETVTGHARGPCHPHTHKIKTIFLELYNTVVPCQRTEGNCTTSSHVKGPVWGPQLFHGTVEATSFSSQRPRLCLGEPRQATCNLSCLIWVCVTTYQALKRT